MSIRRFICITGLICAALSLSPSLAGEKPPTTRWSGKDIGGHELAVPAAQKTSVLLFVMTGQAQSNEAIKQIAASVRDDGQTQVLLIVSGDKAAEHAKALQDKKECPWPIVADPDYVISGKMSVRVWPTTVLITPSGEMLAHLAGVPKNYAKELDSYLAFATGRINRDELDKRLATETVIVDSPEQIAGRHLQVAQRLLEKGLSAQARVELTAGLKLSPQSPSLRLTLVRVLIALGETQEAIKALDAMEGAPVSPSQLSLLRGKAMVQLGKWDAAAELLQRAVKLNPDPAEAWYELGLVYQHSGDAAKAAEAFRKAFESTDTGRKVIPATQPGK